MNKLVLLASLCLIALGCLRIAATYPALTQSYDEPAHIACGMEWLDKGTYTYEPQHPPLTRIAVALGPYLDGTRSQGKESIWAEGNAILYANDYERTLSLARTGNLIFFVLASLAVLIIAWRLYSPAVALASLFIFTMMPSILGNSGVATTDLGVTAFFAPAIIAFAYWFRKPTPARSILLGLLLALSIFSKFSAILFLGIGGIVVALVVRLVQRENQGGALNWRLIKMGTVVVAVFLFAGWACYRFSVQPLLVFPRDLPWVDLFHAKLHLPKDLLMKLGDIGFPLSEFVRGIGAVAKHNVEGHGAYLLGETSLHGWWYFYPVILAIKIPLMILALILTGIFFTLKDYRTNTQLHLLPIAISVSVLLACMFVSNINIGIRHLLPIAPFLAMIAGYGLVRLFQSSKWGKWSGTAALVVIAAASALAHPDYLSHFNLIARERPYEYAIKCDLDWGQHLGAMMNRLRERQIDKASIAYVGTADITRYDQVELNDISTEIPAEISGWVAINTHPLFTNPKFAWLQQYEPVEIVRKTFFLFYFDSPVQTGN